MTYTAAITKKARMFPKKSEKHQSDNKGTLAGVKQCNISLFGDINLMLPIHRRYDASGINGVAPSAGSAPCVQCYSRDVGLSANSHGKNCQP